MMACAARNKRPYLSSQQCDSLPPRRHRAFRTIWLGIVGLRFANPRYWWCLTKIFACKLQALLDITFSFDSIDKSFGLVEATYGCNWLLILSETLATHG
jgi:hypothetical protein